MEEIYVGNGTGDRCQMTGEGWGCWARVARMDIHTITTAGLSEQI